MSDGKVRRDGYRDREVSAADWFGGSVGMMCAAAAVVGAAAFWLVSSFSFAVGTWLAGGTPWMWPGPRMVALVFWRMVSDRARPDEAWLDVSGVSAVSSSLWLTLMGVVLVVLLFLLLALIWSAFGEGNPFAGWSERSRNRPVTNFLTRTWPAKPPYSPRKPGPGVLLGRKGHKLVASSDGLPVMVLGPTGSGKTRHVIGPNSAHWPGPVVITSVKTDLAELVLPSREKMGECYGFDPTGRLWDWMKQVGITPVVWDPVRLMAADPTKEHADLLAQFLTSQSSAHDAGAQGIWATLAQQVLAECLFLAADMQMPLSSALEWMVDMRQFVNADSKEQPWHRLSAEGHKARTRLKVLANKDDKFAGSIEITIKEVSSALAHTADQVDAALVPIGLTTRSGTDESLFLVADHMSQTTHKSVFAAVVRHLFHQTESHIPAEGETPPRPLFALDELANLARLADLPEVLSTIRSKAQVILGIQERSQLEAGWGAANAKTLIGNCPVKTQLPGSSDASALEDWARMSGDPEDEEGAAGWRTIQPGHCRILAGNHRAFEVKMTDPERWLPKPDGKDDAQDFTTGTGDGHYEDPIEDEEDFADDVDGEDEEGYPLEDEYEPPPTERPPPPPPTEHPRREDEPGRPPARPRRAFHSGPPRPGGRRKPTGEAVDAYQLMIDTLSAAPTELVESPDRAVMTPVGNEETFEGFLETADGVEVDEAGAAPDPNKQTKAMAELSIETLPSGEPVGVHPHGFVLDMRERSGV